MAYPVLAATKEGGDQVGQRIRIGMDLGKKTRHQSVRIGASGKPERARPVRTTATSLDEMLSGAEPTGTDVVLEPTGMVWLAVSAYLIFQGCDVYRADTWSAAQFRKFLKKHVKSDITDAEASGRMLAAAEDKLVPMRIPNPRHMALDRLVRQRKQFVDDATGMKLRLEAAADTYIPGLFDALGQDPLTLGKRVLLRHYMDPQKLVDAGTMGLRKVLRKHRRQVQSSVLERVHKAACDANSIWQPLREAGRCPVDFETAQEIITRYLDLLDDLEGHVKALDKSIATAAQAIDEYDAVLSTPGVGPVISSAIVANTGDIRRFPTGSKYVSYCGLAPRKHQSGERDRKGQKITKAGKPILRKYYYLAAERARRIDPELAAFYQRKTEQGLHHQQVVVAIAAKMARRVYAVLQRHHAGETPEYRINGLNGERLTSPQAARLVEERFPSKRQRLKVERKKRTSARSTGMSKRPPIDAAQAETAGASTHYALGSTPATPSFPQEKSLDAS